MLTFAFSFSLYTSNRRQTKIKITLYIPILFSSTEALSYKLAWYFIQVIFIVSVFGLIFLGEWGRVYLKRCSEGFNMEMFNALTQNV